MTRRPGASRPRSAIRCSSRRRPGGGGRGMKVARSADELVERRCRRRRPRPRPPSATTRSISRNILEKPRHIEIQVLGDGRGGAICISASAIARCSAGTRRSGRKGPRPRSTRSSARGSATLCRRHARAAISRRRNDRVPLRERRLLLHRDEHPHPGRASGDRDDHRHRPRERADPHRGGSALCHCGRRRCGSWAMPSNAA